MSLDFLKALFGSVPTAADSDEVKNLYPQSPLDPMKNQTSMLDSMISPPGIQKPLYDYTSSPEENMNDGSPLALQVPQTAQPPTIPTPMSIPKPAAAPNPTKLSPLPKAPTPEKQPETEPLPAQPEEQPKQDDYLELLKGEQKRRKDQDLLLNLLESGDRIGTAIAGGGHLQYEKGKFDGLRKSNERGVEDIKEQQKFKGDQMDQELKGYNVQKAKQQVMDDKAKSDPNSDISKMNRASVLDSLNRIGRKDLASQITPGMSAKQIEDIFGQYNLQNMVTAHEAQQNRLEMAKMRAGEKAEGTKIKQDAADTKRLDQANKMITASVASSRGAFGKSANILRSAEAIETLVKQQPPGQMDSRQIAEVARSLDAMLSQGSATIAGTQKLIPRSMSGDSAKIQEYIGNIPRGAGQAEFIKRMVETVVREKELARKQIKRESRKMLSSYADIAKKNPEAWNLMLQQHDLPQDVFNLDNEETNTENIGGEHPQFNVDQDSLQKEMKKRGM